MQKPNEKLTRPNRELAKPLKITDTVGSDVERLVGRGRNKMGGDDYIICRNSRYSDAHQAAHDLDDQVDAHKKRVAELELDLNLLKDSIQHDE